MRKFFLYLLLNSMIVLAILVFGLFAHMSADKPSIDRPGIAPFTSIR